MTSIDALNEGISHQQGFFKGARGAKTYHQCWLPETKPMAVLFVAHGLTEHSSRYMNLVNYFVPLGYAVYTLDHFGHGRSEGTRNFVEQFEDYTHPLKTYYDMVCEAQPNIPIFLVGHSMGGLIGVRYLLDHQVDFVGAVLSGPLIKIPNPPAAFLISILNIVSILLPKIGVRQLKANALSSDPNVIVARTVDPLVYQGKVTARVAAEINRISLYVQEKAQQITLPLLIAQGGADTIVDPAGAQLLYDTVGSNDKTLKVYDDYYHEVFNESEIRRNIVLNDMKVWLESRLNS